MKYVYPFLLQRKSKKRKVERWEKFGTNKSSTSGATPPIGKVVSS
jgi:hypothetical protein